MMDHSAIFFSSLTLTGGALFTLYKLNSLYKRLYREHEDLKEDHRKTLRRANRAEAGYARVFAECVDLRKQIKKTHDDHVRAGLISREQSRAPIRKRANELRLIIGKPEIEFPHGSERGADKVKIGDAIPPLARIGDQGQPVWPANATDEPAIRQEV